MSKKTLHICYITNEFPRPNIPHGGVGTFVQTISKALAQKGHRVSILSSRLKDEESYTNIDGVHWYKFDSKSWRKASFISYYRNLNKLISKINSEHPIDIVETAELGLSFIKKIKTVRYLIRLHGGHNFFSKELNQKINSWKAFQERRSFKKADGFIAVSKYVKEKTEKYLSYNYKPIEIIYYPIETDSIKPAEIPIQTNRLVFAGTVCEKKGIRQLIEALGSLLPNYPDLMLDVYGRDWSFDNRTSYINWLKQQFDENVINKVHFHGSRTRDNLLKEYDSALCCIFPSHMETLGLVAPEAMAKEKVVIFTEKGPGPEVIKDQYDGLLCDPFDSKSIAEKIEWVLQRKCELEQIALNARESVQRKFDLPFILSQNLKFYNEILNPK